MIMIKERNFPKQNTNHFKNNRIIMIMIKECNFPKQNTNHFKNNRIIMIMIKEHKTKKSDGGENDLSLLNCWICMRLPFPRLLNFFSFLFQLIIYKRKKKKKHHN